MPSPHTLATFALAAALLVLIPGPNTLYLLTRSISEGRRVGLASTAGIEVGTMVHIAAAALGLSVLIASSAVAFNVVKYAGAAYLVYLGVRALLSKDGGHGPAELEKAGAAKAFRSGVLVNVLNPKVAVFFLALLPQFVDPAAGAVPLQIVVLGLVLASIGVCNGLVLVFLSAPIGTWLRARPKMWSRQRFVSGGVYLALGAGAALAGTGAKG